MHSWSWSTHAASVEAAIADRHAARLFGIPGTELAVVSWPAPWQHRWWLEWHYWWQAHLIDCLADAQLRAPTPQRVDRIQRVIRSHRLRNLSGWTNRYYDDMAWLGLALERAGRVTGRPTPYPVAVLTHQIRDHWTERDVLESGVVQRVGGLPWRRGSDFFNAPANGPAGILLARTGHVTQARAVSDWLHEVLRHPTTGLIQDGVRANGELVELIYSYCQGVALGLEVELARLTGDPVHCARANGLIDAIAQHLCTDAVITDGGGGDGGLFNGILARYLALAAEHLPGSDAAATEARRAAREIVLTSASACWDNRAEVVVRDSAPLPLFGWVWTHPARIPLARSEVGESIDGATSSSSTPERDLSVQLSGWMLLEAAARLEHVPT